MDPGRAGRYAATWLLNPMVATISTRGSSEGVLVVLVIGLLWAVLQKRIALAGVLLGLGVHLKIYPVVYGVSILWFLDRDCYGASKGEKGPGKRMKMGKGAHGSETNDVWGKITGFLNRERIILVGTSLVTFMVLNTVMYYT